MSKNEIETRYSLPQHIEYVLAVMGHKDHETYTLRAALESIEYHMAESFDTSDFSARVFMDHFAVFLAKNDVIDRPVAEEVFAYSDRVVALTKRNFRMVDLVKAFETILRAQEVTTGSLD